MLALCFTLPCAACGGQKAPAAVSAPSETPAITETPALSTTPTEAPTPSPEPTETSAPVSYADTLFDPGFVHTVDVRIADEDWAELLAAPIDKTKYHASVRIDGESFENVSFATKGNSSMYYVADDPGSERYSFRLNFGKYEEGQTYHGLDKLSLNNLFCDAAYMKDALSYVLFRRCGVPAPLTSYVWLTVNGEDRGLYLAVEDLDVSFLARNFGGEGVIYKPESKNLKLTLDAVRESRIKGLNVSSNPHGSDLIYTDDDPESYPDIFDNAETHAEPEDNEAVIAALKCLAEGGELETCLDTDEIIRFFAVHNFLLNYDSYTGAMLHNLILYEHDGVLALLPWDYNLIFGTFTPGVGKEVLVDMTDLVNQGIDAPLIGTTEAERPMWRWIVSDARCLAAYHAALGELAGAFLAEYGLDELRALEEMLLPYVERDPTAFYSTEEFRAACETLRQVCLRRAESVRRQLDGTLAPVGSQQLAADKVDASDLRLMDLGAFVVGEEFLALAYPEPGG